MHAIPVTKHKHEAAFDDLVVRSYGSDSAREKVAAWRAFPGYRQDLSRLVIDGDAAIAGALVRDVPVRVGEAVVPAASIGFPVHDPDSSEDAENALVDALLGGLVDAGHCVTRVVGDRYHKHGFVGGIIRHRCQIISTGTEVGTPLGWGDRPIGTDDINAVVELYARTIGTRTLEPQFTADHWRARMDSGALADTRVVFDPTERLRGYAIIKPKNPTHVFELAVDDDGTAAVAVLGMLFRYKQKQNIDSLTVDALPDDAFAHITLEQFGVTWQRHTDVRNGTLYRIVAVEPLMQLLQSTLANRWKRRPYGTPYATVSLRSPVGRFSIVPSRDSLRVVAGSEVGRPVSIPVDAMTRLVLGFCTAGCVLNAAGVHVPNEAIRVLDAVFSPPPSRWM